MVLQIRILSNENAHFMRTLEISQKEDFLHLHHTLQEMLGNEPAQMAKFHLADEEWDPYLGVEVDDSHSDSEKNLHEEIGKFLKQEGDKIIYEFDLLHHRYLFMELACKLKGKCKAPLFTESIGLPPTTNPSQKKITKSREEELPDALDSGEFEDYTELFGDIEDIF